MEAWKLSMLARFMFKISLLFKSISIEGKEWKLSCEI